jgi:solute:Na+ symporter, SSS family
MSETTILAADNVLRLNLGWLDYLLVAIYFVFVLGIGFIARSQISTSLDFFLSAAGCPRG